MLKEWLGMAEGILQDLHQDHEEVGGLIEQCLKTEASAERNQIQGNHEHADRPFGGRAAGSV